MKKSKEELRLAMEELQEKLNAATQAYVSAITEPRPPTYAIGDVVYIYGDAYMLVKAKNPRYVIATCLRGGNRYGDGTTVEFLKVITVKELRAITGLDAPPKYNISFVTEVIKENG